MNSTISDDYTREHLALEAAKCLQNIYKNSQNVTSLHKELLEINLSVTTFIEESKLRLEGLRLHLAHEARSSHNVVKILIHIIMSKSPTTALKRTIQIRHIRHLQEDNENKVTERQQARKFITWYKRMIDDERQNLCLYLADDALLEWFGRTIKTRKKVSAFLKHDMQCSSHDFTTVESIEKIKIREDRASRRDDTVLASPLNSPEVVRSKSERSGKRRILRSDCDSPEWAEGCKPQEDSKDTEIKRIKTQKIESQKSEEIQNRNGVKRPHSGDEIEINSKGDGVLGRRIKRKCVPVTPPNCEVGQGDCLPSTSGTDADRSHDTLNAQLPKLAVECNGYIKFTRSKNNHPSDTRKWERNCKVQISYSEDPLNIGEYILWALLYTDESKCKRNLLAAFEEVAKEEELKKMH